MIGDNLTSSILQRALDGAWQRQKAISANISNQETPAYKAQRVSFEDALARAVGKYDSEGTAKDSLSDIKTSRIAVYDDPALSMRADGNNVDIDQEQVEMVKTQIQYIYLTRGVTDMYSRLKYAITGR